MISRLEAERDHQLAEQRQRQNGLPLHALDRRLRPPGTTAIITTTTTISITTSATTTNNNNNDNHSNNV